MVCYGQCTLTCVRGCICCFKLDYILAKLVAFIKRFTRDIFSYLCWNGLNIKAHKELHKHYNYKDIDLLILMKRK